MNYLKQYNIPFAGLKAGKHNFHFHIDKEFLSHFNFPDVGDISADLDFSLEKQSTMLTLIFQIGGTVKTLCDLCADDLNLPIQINEELIIKFGQEKKEVSEKITVIPFSETEFDISQYIYEFITFAIPLKKVHLQGKCNKETLKKLNEIKSQTEKKEKIDPRWQELLKLNLS